MDNAFLGTGLACLIAAVIGGGLKAFGIEIPVLTSQRRQLALGILGVALIAIATLRPTLSSPSPKTLTGGVSRTTPSPEQQTGPVSLSVNSEPRTVAPGGSTRITVFATASDGTPVAGARVTVSAGGGVFESTGATKVTGQTDDQGLFKTTWRTYEASAYTGDMSYVLGVEAAKEGMGSAHGDLQVFVRK